MDIEPESKSAIAIPLQNVNSLEKGLTQNSFNPTKNSPPNEFLHKLNERLSQYYTTEPLVYSTRHDEIK